MDEKIFEIVNENDLSLDDALEIWQDL